MGKLRAVVIGCGGRGKAHALAYKEAKDVSFVAFAEPAQDRAEKMSEEYPRARAYKDYRKMLREEKPDVVAVCTWPKDHKKMVLAAVRSGARLINAEKPMAPTYGEALSMHRACEKAGVMCTYSHQRRFAPEFVKARALLREGAIGKLQRIEGRCPNLFDWGTHWFDMMFFFNEQTPALWVMGQIDVAQESLVFGATLETQGVSYVTFENGVNGLLTTGSGNWGNDVNAMLPGGGILLVGEEGRMTMHARNCPLEVRRMGRRKAERPDLSKVRTLHKSDSVAGVLDSLAALKAKKEPELSSRKALMATELIFATYESSRRRGRIDLPLKAKDSALLGMIEAREIGYTLKAISPRGRRSRA